MGQAWNQEAWVGGSFSSIGRRRPRLPSGWGKRGGEGADLQDAWKVPQTGPLLSSGRRLWR